MEKRILIDNKVVPVSETKTKFLTTEALNAPTPSWATWVFRGTIIVTTVAVFWVSGTSLISESSKVEIMLALKTIDALVLGISKLFGIVEK